MLQVYLVRHGETEWNAARRIQGQSDSPLTATGVHQAHLVGKRVSREGVTHVISSDLGRTPVRPRKSLRTLAVATLW
ncbi:2,3-bisphosphoglycerate-dependent phosphoglycerate mutase [Serratia fonticola]|uniref:2,3-bisphosphoglycerate-dependent phosphoglycerate mutase n=1 Tax=Serratia fonticola TaxID=47917 RepID=A0A4U9UIZ0_SERFO|nr:2,3-bisphosphoglycerate-dependent phosphoglycerate mutase [Serratia fonticola]